MDQETDRRIHVRAGNRDIDQHIANRVRHNRVMAGLTQQRMADLIGVSFQQFQKYEIGQNRISASQLYRIATALGLQVSYFFEGVEGENSPQAVPHDRMLLGLIQNYKGIRKQRHRELVSELARGLFQSQGAHDA